MKFPLLLAAILSAAFLVACSGDSDPAPAATEVAAADNDAPAPAEATTEASAEGRPAMTFVGGDAVVTDPANGRVVRVNLDALSAVDEWEVGGAPASLAFVGLGGDGR